MEYNYSRINPERTTGGERRGYKRYITDVLLKFWYSEEIDRWQDGRVVDFSLEGLQLETSVELLPDSTLLFDLSALSNRTLETPLVTGHVVRRTGPEGGPYQYGVFFLTAETQYDGILEDDDRDRNVLVEVLANLIMSGKARLRQQD